MTHTKPWAIGIVVICTIFTAIGSLLFKKGMSGFVLEWPGMLNAYPVLIGLFFYFLGFVLLAFAFRHGELSVLFPFVSLSFVWVAILSYAFLSEMITTLEVIGLAAIVTGVVSIGLSSRKRRIRVKG